MHRAGEWVTPTLAGRALAREAAALLLAGRARRSRSSARRRPPRACRRCSPPLLLVGRHRPRRRAPLRLGGGAARRLRGRAPSLLPFAYGRAASMDMLLAATVTRGDRPRRACASSASPGRARDRGRRRRRRPRDARQGPARPAAARRSSSAGYLARHARVALAARAASLRAVAAFVRRGRPLVRRDPARPGPALPGRLHPEPQRPALHARRSTTTPARSGTTCRSCSPGLFPWSGLALPGARAHRARELAERPLRAALARRCPSSSSRSPAPSCRATSCPCVPPLAILMGRAADRLITRAATRPSACSPAASWPSSASCSRRSSPRRRPRSSGSQEPLWRSAVPLAVWAVVVAFLFSRRVGADPAGRASRAPADRGGRPAAPVALAAPPILARRESGRALFVPAMGREVLAWGAWRTAWMAGYFYNDGRCARSRRRARCWRRSTEGPTLVLAGPSERRRLEAMGSLEVHTLARGPRENALLRVEKRPKHVEAREGSEKALSETGSRRGLLRGTKSGSASAGGPSSPG